MLVTIADEGTNADTMNAARYVAEGTSDLPASSSGGPDFPGHFASGHRHTPRSLAAALEAMEIAIAGDVQSVAGPATMAEEIATKAGWEDLRMRAWLLRADVLGRSGKAAELGKISMAVNGWATAHGDVYLLARSHRLLGFFYRRIGDPAEALAHAIKSVADLPDWVAPQLRAGHLLSLANALGDAASFDEANRRFEEALAIAVGIADWQLSLMVLNNMAYTQWESNDLPAATELVDRMWTVATQHDVPMDAYHLDTIARIEMAQERYAEAEAILQPLLDDPAGSMSLETDALPECLLTVVEAQRRQGALDRAQISLDRARSLCTEHGLSGIGVQVRQEQAELYAATGRYQDAYQEYQRFHTEFVALQSEERDARAQAMQAVFETEEARRDSDRFRELAFRDPLTGLHNRRYVDEQLERLAVESFESRRRLAVALVDLDFFKLVNDTFSHNTGDLVLIQIAQLLVDNVPEAAVVGRMGGEEFLVVLPDTDPVTAAEQCERLRQAIRSHPWHPLVGDLPITTSIGVTITDPVDGDTVTPSVLLSRADRNLYTAKRSGRDMVVADPVPHPGARDQNATERTG